MFAFYVDYHIDTQSQELKQKFSKTYTISFEKKIFCANIF